MSWLFRIAIGIDCIALAIAVYFLLTDMIKGYSYNNGSLLLAILLMGGWVGLCLYLQSRNMVPLARLLAWIPAIPLLGYAILILMFIILKPKF